MGVFFEGIFFDLKGDQKYNHNFAWFTPLQKVFTFLWVQWEISVVSQKVLSKDPTQKPPSLGGTPRPKIQRTHFGKPLWRNLRLESPTQRCMGSDCTASKIFCMASGNLGRSFWANPSGVKAKPKWVALVNEPGPRFAPGCKLPGFLGRQEHSHGMCPAQPWLNRVFLRPSLSLSLTHPTCRSKERFRQCLALHMGDDPLWLDFLLFSHGVLRSHSFAGGSESMLQVGACNSQVYLPSGAKTT